MIVAIAFAFLAVDWLNAFTSKSLTLNPLTNGLLFVGLVIFALIVGVIAGIYPAFVISGFKPAAILKGAQGQLPTLIPAADLTDAAQKVTKAVAVAA